MSACGPKQTYSLQRAMSAFDPSVRRVRLARRRILQKICGFSPPDSTEINKSLTMPVQDAAFIQLSQTSAQSCTGGQYRGLDHVDSSQWARCFSGKSKPCSTRLQKSPFDLGGVKLCFGPAKSQGSDWRWPIEFRAPVHFGYSTVACCAVRWPAVR